MTAPASSAPREVRMDGEVVVAQLVAMRSMADAMSALATTLLQQFGAEPALEAPVVQGPDDLNPARFGRTT